MTQIKGPAIFLAQFSSEEKPFNDLKSICLWAASLGYKGVQIPTWDVRMFDLKRAAERRIAVAHHVPLATTATGIGRRRLC